MKQALAKPTTFYQFGHDGLCSRVTLEEWQGMKSPIYEEVDGIGFKKNDLKSETTVGQFRRDAVFLRM